ncbi:EAL domain-containing protein [Effusibacillus consociatus]|uniref:EAL domain-containing protein n=1 Tax=Effusibacillus consociatus TaxID=1117041 RepID=A0ABV9PZE0_9BACL
MISAITAMAHNLNIKVIVEGVETEEQVKFLQQKKCHEIQGFYCSPALPPENFERFLKLKTNQSIKNTAI